MLKVSRIAGHNLHRFFAAGKSRMQRIINAPAHDSPAARFPERCFIISQGQWLHQKRSLQTQHQLGGHPVRHLVKPGEGGKGFRQRMGVRERSRGIVQSRQASRMLRVRLQDGPTRMPVSKKVIGSNGGFVPPPPQWAWRAQIRSTP